MSYATRRGEKEIPMTSSAVPARSLLPDPATPFGAQVARRLREEMVIWFTSEAADGTPQPNPVWFLWDGESFLVYCQRHAKRLEHIRHNPRVALNFNSNKQGEDFVVFTGTARIATGEPHADQNRAYLAKYQKGIEQVAGSVQNFVAQYSVPVRVTPERVRGL
jgi:PPOX class probable F420-dependent enzyme